MAAHLYSKVQEVSDHVDLPIGGRSMEWGVALLVLTGHFRTVVNEQGHDVQVALTDRAAENMVNLHGAGGRLLHPNDHVSFELLPVSAQLLSRKAVL